MDSLHHLALSFETAEDAYCLRLLNFLQHCAYLPTMKGFPGNFSNAAIKMLHPLTTRSRTRVAMPKTFWAYL